MFLVQTLLITIKISGILLLVFQYWSSDWAPILCSMWPFLRIMQTPNRFCSWFLHHIPFYKIVSEKSSGTAENVVVYQKLDWLLWKMAVHFSGEARRDRDWLEEKVHNMAAKECHDTMQKNNKKGSSRVRSLGWHGWFCWKQGAASWY